MTDRPVDPERDGEVATDTALRADGTVHFIGRIRTPWSDRRDCPRRGAPDGPVCRIELEEAWWPALDGLAAHQTLEILYWMHLARRDLLLQNPKRRGDVFGTFALRSPNRPNPIATSRVALVETRPDGLLVRGLDCIDGTPLIDIKPQECPMWPQPGAVPAGGGP